MAWMEDERSTLAPRRPLLRGAASMMHLDDLRRHSGTAMIIGLITLALGILALGHVWMATKASVIFLGILLFAAGIAQFVLSFAARKWNWFFLYLLSSIVTMVAGVIAISNTALAAVTLTAVLATYLFIDGLYRMFMATALSPPSWGWIVLNGLVEVGLGFMLWNQWPFSGVYAIGIIVAVDLIWLGATYTIMAWRVRRVTSDVEGAITEH